MSKLRDYVFMDTVKEIRHRNFLELVREFGENEVKTAVVMSDAQFRHIAGSLKEPKVKTRNIGDRLARKIEKALGQELGYLDNIHYDSEAEILANVLKNRYNDCTDDYKLVIKTVIYHGFQEDKDIKSSVVSELVPTKKKGG